MPRIGAWYADVDVDAIAPLTGSVTSEIDGVSFVGTVLRSGTHGGRVQARIVGGKGGLAKELDAQNYANGPTAQTILTDILRGAGETLSSTADASLLSTTFARWQRDADTASECMVALLDALGATWRVLSDGTIWVGVDVYPEQELVYDLIDESWQTGDVIIAPEAPELRPGVTFRGQKLEEVVHYVSAGKLRTEARPNSVGSTFARIFRGVRRRIDYSRLYPAKVVGQNADKTLQLEPDDALMKGAGLDKVPIRHGLPGVTVTVPPGTRVRFGFEAGDPGRPYAALFESGSVTAVSLDGGARPLARVGDTVSVFLPPEMAIAGTITGVGEFMGLLTITNPAIGIIETGAPKFLG